jgi:hypothetical protein
MRRRHVPFSPVLLAAPLLAAAAAAPPPAPPPEPLAAFTPAQVRGLLGEPAVASQEGKGALWTYRREGCALMVFFKDAGRGLRVSGVAASGRKRGDAPPPVEICMAAPAEG